MSEKRMSQLDPHQISRYTYDEINNAQRVIIVNKDDYSELFASYKTEPTIIKETKIEYHEMPKWQKYCILIQTFSFISFILLNIFNRIH